MFLHVMVMNNQYVIVLRFCNLSDISVTLLEIDNGIEIFKSFCVIVFAREKTNVNTGY